MKVDLAPTNIALVRYPGGTVANLFNWKRAIGAETTIMTKWSGQPARDAADYVEYMNAPLGTNPNGGTA